MTDLANRTYTIKPTSRFRKDLKRIGRQRLEGSDRAKVIDILAGGLRRLR
jgi:hypothetical protein